MDLTSLRRVKHTLNITKADEDSLLSALVGSASTQIVAYLRRIDQSGGDAIELKSRVEYIDPRPGQRRFYTRAFPIQSVTSFYGDSTGRYTGSESALPTTDYMIDSDSRSVVVQVQPIWPQAGFYTAQRTLRLTYVAGLAASATVSDWTKSADVGGTLSVGKYVRGETSTSIGYITATASGTISIEVLAGKFLNGETIKEYRNLVSDAMDVSLKEATGVTATLTTCTARSLVESHPSLVLACERHIAHWKKNRGNFDDLTVNQDGATRFSRSDMKNDYEFLPEIRALLAPYRNNLVTA